jgi:VIT1/CCC1 family predicted Fe2+/Mn2+ transporter
MKMAFLSYTIISIIEFIVIKPKDINTYLSSRMLSAILFSYFSFVIWFIVPVLFGPIEVAWGEILYSNIILALSLAATIYIETFIARIKFDRKITWVITAIYIIIMVVFVVSAFHTPQMDVFEPHAH